MYRFLLRPRWIVFHVVVLAAVVGMIGLGFWQRDRLEDRRAFNRVVAERRVMPPVPLDQALAEVDDCADPDALDGLEWRPVTATGRFLADEEIIVVNRSQGGAAGVNAVTPLELDDGTLVLVSRGFVVTPASPPPPPPGTVTVNGRIRTSEQRRFGQLTDAPTGELREVQRIDLERLQPQLPGDLLPVWVDLVTSTPPQPEGLSPTAPPELTEGSHLSYMFQWWFFSAAVATGWVVAVRRSILTRRRGASVA